ncbi:MAG: ABC transporter ATP-binding protein [Chloroflexi bacterium]|nr:ABC transporter ATP-binding protein [Chloroflexota bacterium]MCY3715353.1 ABC transporter ATP-binding protein [Chloroflexota bacterium]MDE2649562.1 ABC transporter ATP-binding protein [Chloroflexota bacterium]MXV93034.1 ABC transporter ATP-binding protein [Chloroflexota bacterium]MXX51197.1 ABC transporter ATP-binding protein [Chloroflexota bacterium]
MSAEFLVNSPISSNHNSPFRFILSHILRHPIAALLLVVGAFCNAFLAGVVPGAVGSAFDAILLGGEGTMRLVLNNVLLIIGSQSLRSLLQFLRNFSAEVFAQRFERDVRDELYSSLLGKSMSYHDRQPVGETMARVTNDVREMNLMMNPGINLVMGANMFLIMPALYAPGIHPQLILAPLLFIVAHLVVQVYFVLRLHPIAQQVRGSFGRMNARLAESLDGLEVVKGAAQEESEMRAFNSLADLVRDKFIDQGEFEARYLSILLFGLTVVMALAHAASLFEAGLIAEGDVVAYLGLINLFQFPVFISLFSSSRIASGYASAARILEVIKTRTLLDQNQRGYSGEIRGEIVFEGVSFGYSTDDEVLNDISFRVRPGQTVAIVGQTGAGKSTVSKLINRIYDVHSGRVLVDGVDVREWNLQALRSQISIIEQDIFLFSRNVAENIAFGSEQLDMEGIIDAAKAAQAHDFISSFPAGYETIIGQRGMTLSGGQRQRLALARAFQTDPPVLILDDSTSAIDSATEDKIQRAIWSAAHGRTTLLITHRLSQIRWADHIVVLRRGRVVAQGSHEDLLRTSQSYRHIFDRYAPADSQARVGRGG